MLHTAVLGSTFDLAAQPIYHATNDNYLDVKNGPLAIAGTGLADLYVDYRRAAKSGSTFTPSAAEQLLQMPDNNDVYVDIGTRIDFNTFANRMKAAGMTVVTSDSSLGVLEGYVPISTLLSLSTRSDVALLRPIYRPTVNKAGIADNAGDIAMNTVNLRNSYGLNGAGVTVGVISNSYQLAGTGGNTRTGTGTGGMTPRTNSSVRTGDLPNNVNVLNDYNDTDGFRGSATDEGRAMLEEIHDVAPGASLAFSTGEGGLLTFAKHVTALHDAGASVITDDLSYFDESFFQPSVIDNSISNVVAGGVAYTSSAGNSADSGFSQKAQYATVGNDRYVDFDPSSKVATRMLIKVGTGGQLVLQWDNPYNGVTGNVTADMDIFLYEPGTNNVVAMSTDFNTATGVPVEHLDVAPGSYDVEIQLVSVIGTNPPPTIYKLAGPAGISYTKYKTTRGGTFGHNAGPSAISVAAVGFNEAPPVVSATKIKTEDYSSQGPTTQIFDAAGNRLATPVVLQKPDISGIDNVNISFPLIDYTTPNLYNDTPDNSSDPDTLPNFQGTSAAAPNVAAGIALIREVAPGLTQDQILSALKSTARATNGTAQGTWDDSGGYGLVDFNAALAAAVATFQPTIEAVTPNPRSDGVDTLTITFNQRVTGFDASDLSLTRDGGANLLTSFQTLSTSDNVTFTLNDLTDITSTNGTYTLTLPRTGTGIHNLIGTPLRRGASTSFSVFAPSAPPTRPSNFAAETVGSTSINLTWTDRSNNESGFQILKSTNPAFSSSSIIKVGANVTSYLDTDVKASNIYYYRIRAVNTLNGDSSYTAAVSSLTAVTGDVLIDNTSKYAHISGSWSTETSGTGYLGENYLSDDGTGKGAKSVKYIPTLAGNGSYYIYARFTGGSGNAKNVPFDIYYGPKAALKTTVFVNEQKGGHGYVLIGGPYAMDAGTGAALRISNTGTTGNVIADSIRFLPSAPITPQAIGTTNSSINPFGSTTIGGKKHDDGDATDSL